MADIILVTLVYNRREYLGRALLSAWNQTLDKSKWIHLLVDNNSTDGAGQIAERFCESHPNSNVRFVRQPANLGIQGGHNWVLYDYIPKHCPEVKVMSLLEGDDLLPDYALTEVHKTFEEHPEIGETYSDFSIIDKNERLLFKAHPKAILAPDQFSPSGQKYLRQKFKHIPIGHQRSYSVKCLLDVGGFDGKYEYANDIDVAAKMLTKYLVIKIPKVLYIWRQHLDSASCHNSPEQTKQFEEILRIYTQKWTEMGLM